MIINIGKQKNRNHLINFYFLMRGIFFDLLLFNQRNKSAKDSDQLSRLFKNKYPKLKWDSMGNNQCVSCFVCQDACPVDAIEIIKPELINFPSSLKTGEGPKNFNLDLSKCTQCGLCRDVCFIGALSCNGSYEEDGKVDLVTKKTMAKSVFS